MNDVDPFARLLWLALGFGLCLYAVTGGADLGAGFLSLIARGPRKREQRAAIQHGLAPIWEANHVWLIFVVVVMFSAFPRAFAVLSISMHVPIALALVGIVLRGAAVSFHAYGMEPSAARERWSRIFAWSSAITPVFLGTVLGGVATGRVRVQGDAVTSGFFAGWTTPFAVLVGLLALALFSALAAVYLAAENAGGLERDFVRRAFAAEIAGAVLAFAAFWRAKHDAPRLFDKLLGSSWSLPLQLATAASAVLTLVLLQRGRARLARFSVAAQVALVVIGWGLSMDGHFVVPDVALASAGSRAEVLPALCVALALGSLLLAPALFYLYRVFKLRD